MARSSLLANCSLLHGDLKFEMYYAPFLDGHLSSRKLHVRFSLLQRSSPASTEERGLRRLLGMFTPSRPATRSVEQLRRSDSFSASAITLQRFEALDADQIALDALVARLFRGTAWTYTVSLLEQT